MPCRCQETHFGDANTYHWPKELGFWKTIFLDDVYISSEKNLLVICDLQVWRFLSLVYFDSGIFECGKC